MATRVERQLGARVNVPAPDLVQFVAAYGATILGVRRLQKRGQGERPVLTTGMAQRRGRAVGFEQC